MAHDGTIVGSPTFAAAKFSTGLTATSDSGYVSLPTGTFSMTNSSSWTIEMWVKTSTTAIRFVLATAQSGDANAIYAFSTAAGKFGFFVPGTGDFAGNLDSGIAINDNAFHHVAAVMSGGTTIKLFVDGVQGGGDFVGQIDNPPTTHTGGFLGRWTLADGFAWPGAIDEVAIWTSAKYTTNFTPPVAAYTGTEANLFALYHLNGDATDSAVTSTTILMNDAAIIYSPYNWNVTSGSAKTINSGAYFRTIFSGTSVSLLTDTSADGTPYSQFWARLDDQGWVQFTLSGGSPTISLGTGLPNRKHLLEVILKSTTQTQPRWISSGTMLTVTGILLDGGAAVTAPEVRTKRILIYGDSITEGALVKNNTATDDTDRDDVLGDYSYALATAVDAEVGIVAFAGQGVTVTGVDVPPLTSAYNFIYNGVSRSFASCPDLVIYNMGTNDGATNITSGLTAVANGILGSCPSSKHLLLVPFNGSHASQIVAAAAAIGSQATAVDTTGWFDPADSSDGVHPYDYSQVGLIAPRLFPLVAAQLYPNSGGGGASIPFIVIQ